MDIPGKDFFKCALDTSTSMNIPLSEVKEILFEDNSTLRQVSRENAERRVDFSMALQELLLDEFKPMTRFDREYPEMAEEYQKNRIPEVGGPLLESFTLWDKESFDILDQKGEQNEIPEKEAVK